MRMLARNKKMFYIAHPISEVPEYDSDGNLTGAKAVRYTKPELYRASVNESNTRADFASYGINPNESETLVYYDPDLPVVDGSILWIVRGNIREYDENKAYAVGERCIGYCKYGTDDYRYGIYEAKYAGTLLMTFANFSNVQPDRVVNSVVRSLNSVKIEVRGIR